MRWCQQFYNLVKRVWKSYKLDNIKWTKLFQTKIGSDQKTSFDRYFPDALIPDMALTLTTWPIWPTWPLDLQLEDLKCCCVFCRMFLSFRVGWLSIYLANLAPPFDSESELLIGGRGMHFVRLRPLLSVNDGCGRIQRKTSDRRRSLSGVRLRPATPGLDDWNHMQNDWTQYRWNFPAP